MADYPFYFDNYKICIHCASSNVKLIDKFDKPVKGDSIYPISKLRCMDCNTEYYIRWVKNDKGKIIPICCSDIDIDSVANNIMILSESLRRDL